MSSPFVKSGREFLKSAFPLFEWSSSLEKWTNPLLKRRG
jgi:hypothetical protein